MDFLDVIYHIRYSKYVAYKNFLDLKGSVVYNFCPVENGLQETFEDAGGAG